MKQGKKECKYYRIFRKIRLWLIKKLNAIPKENMNSSVIYVHKVPFIEVQAKETLPYPNWTEEEYREHAKKYVAEKIGLELLENKLIEFFCCEDNMTRNLSIVGCVKVAQLYANGGTYEAR